MVLYMEFPRHHRVSLNRGDGERGVCSAMGKVRLAMLQSP